MVRGPELAPFGDAYRVTHLCGTRLGHDGPRSGRPKPLLMTIFSALTERLSVLTMSLDSPGADLQAVLDVLTDDLRAAIPSFLGLTVTLDQVGGPVTLTAVNLDLALAAEASLEIPLDAINGSATGGTMVCYARQSGSFVTLAETGRGCRVDGRVLGRRSGPEAGAGTERHVRPTRGIRPGRQLPSGPDPAEPVGVSGLGDLTVVNRAIGVLISRGDSPAEAHVELLHRAARGALSLPDVARKVLRSTSAPPPGPAFA